MGNIIDWIVLHEIQSPPVMLSREFADTNTWFSYTILSDPRIYFSETSLILKFGRNSWEFFRSEVTISFVSYDKCSIPSLISSQTCLVDGCTISLAGELENRKMPLGLHSKFLPTYLASNICRVFCCFERARMIYGLARSNEISSMSRRLDLHSCSDVFFPASFKKPMLCFVW